MAVKFRFKSGRFRLSMAVMNIFRVLSGNPARGVVLLLLSGCLAAHGAALRVYDLKCDYQTNPPGLDDAAPGLSWKLDAPDRNQCQTAFQIMAATSEANLKHGEYDVWDTGRVDSSVSVAVPYHGRPLHSDESVYWKVRVWNKGGAASASAQSACWTMGLLKPSDWRATWIMRSRREPLTDKTMYDDDPAPLFRKEFQLDKKVRRALVHVSGLGYYELSLNGKRVGDHVLDPGWTTYAKRVLYSTYDVTSLLQRGRNAAGLMVGNGWFNPVSLKMWGHVNLRDFLTVGEPRACMQLRVEYEDGEVETIGTDETWRTGPGPLLRNSIYLGEVYDARREEPGWDRAGFDDANWTFVVPAREPVGPPQAQDAPPIQVTRILKPVKLSEPRPGVYLVDFGQNFAGWVRLQMSGPAGTAVTLRYGELLYADGTLNAMTSVFGQIKGGGRDYRYGGKGAPATAFQTDRYILKGKGREAYCPRFTFHGFRYVEITGLSHAPALGDIKGLRLNSDVAPAGSFNCSNEEFNRIQEMVLWTELSNLFSVESDCPHREKLGYGGDMVAASGAEIFNFDMERFYAKAVRDLGDAVRANGGFTETAPYAGLSDEGLGGGAGPIGWGSAQPFLQWELYQYYGDIRLLAEQYAATKRWISFLRSCSPDGLLDNGISDHESLASKPRALTGTAFYYLNATLFAKIARALGKEQDATDADALAQQIKAVFNQKFLKTGAGIYGSGTQACQSFALSLGLVPNEETNRAAAVLAHDISDVHQGHLTTGIFGTKFMLNALTGAGRADLAYEIVNQRTFPGWGYMLENGATTLWEHWAMSDNTYSHNHPMFGSVSEWFYNALGGIKPAPDAVAFDKILIQPQPVAGLDWVKASYESVRGKIASEWKHHDGRFTLKVRVPAGASATVWVPGRLQKAKCPAGARWVRTENGRAVMEIGSGEYEFSSELP
jgi:alpha-L-rhamnosidase